MKKAFRRPRGSRRGILLPEAASRRRLSRPKRHGRFRAGRALVGTSCLSGCETREIIIQHETFLDRAFHAFNELFAFGRGERRHRQHLGFASAEERRTVDPLEKTSFGVKIANLVHFPSVNPLTLLYRQGMDVFIHLFFEENLGGVQYALVLAGFF